MRPPVNYVYMAMTSQGGDRMSASSRIGVFLATLFAVAASLVILTGNRNGRAASDMINYHEPAIRTFARQWPQFDLKDYLSATTPGYHIALATAARWVSPATAAIQFAGLLFAVQLVISLTTFGTSRVGNREGLALAAPFAASLYVFVSGAYLLPDNAGWLGVLLVLIVALRERQTWTWLVMGGLALAALVFTRQIHLWAAAPLWAAAFFNPPVSDVAPSIATRCKAGAFALLITMPAFIIVAYFYKLWGGLTPPMFKDFHASGVNLAAPAFLLALAGGLSPFFIRWWWPSLSNMYRTCRWIAPTAIVIGVAFAIIPATTYDQHAGRWGGVLWDVARKLPVIGGRTSALILILAPLGALVIASLLWGMSRQRVTAAVTLTTLLAFTAAQAASYQLWQRYNEPFVLMVLALACPLQAPSLSMVPLLRRAAWLPIVLAAGFAAMTGWKVTHDAPAGKLDVLKPELQQAAPESSGSVPSR